ncbi:MAG: hypothetical protein Q9190_003143 [Brigantiaea leucoxantha]
MSADLIFGVAFFVPEKTDPERAKLLQKWPGKEDKTENKVPTSLIYHDDNLQSWGFLCDRLDQPEHPNPKRQQYFKLWLDRPHLQEVFSGTNGPTHDDVKKWFTDFLDRLYQHIKRTFSNGPYAKEWRSRVHFYFSVPTTWKSQNVFTTYKNCIKRAGFDKERNHDFSIGLTEAEAAAIHTFRSKALTVKDRLESAERSMPTIADDDPDWAKKTAWDMSQGDFQYYKCAFGTVEGTHEKFKIKIPDFPTSRDFPDACIEKKHMTFTRQDMCHLFDRQLEGIYSVLDDQLGYLRRERPSKQVDYLVLSGGLGSSVYVKNKLIERYANAHDRASRAKSLQIYTADDPQTAVVQGLVLNQAQQHQTGSEALESRTSPASYGVLCKKPYDPEQHIGLELERDELDGKMYAINIIHWFVKKGDSVSKDRPISYNFMRKLSPDTKLHRGQWTSTVVISWKDRAYLPKALSDEAMTLCTIKSNTSDLRMEDFEKVGHRFPWSSKFYIAKYKVQVNIEVANILFEVWCNDFKLSEDQRIHVQWKEGAEMSRPLDSGNARDIWVP